MSSIPDGRFSALLSPCSAWRSVSPRSGSFQLGPQVATHVSKSPTRTGMYSIVRHPLYLGNALSVVGVTSFFRCGWLAMIVGLAFAIYYERIILAEEAFLTQTFNREFEAWAERVPVILPRPGLWRPPALAFSWRTVVRAEYQGVVAILFMLSASEALAGFTVAGHVLANPIWVGEMTIAAAGLAICRYPKKRTNLLRVGGR
ncbi:MAG: isoprenylcysteine carboxylmethyltransferase family protein [Deltaproteobacteria bacterium]|nr:isoprenylcysteine carboxylmethyltransferase family protein [Deltaproteobacteria bacterium]